MAKHLKPVQRLEKRSTNMQLRHGIYLFAALLIGAASAYADRISVNDRDTDRNSISFEDAFTKTLPQNFFALHGFSLAGFEANELRLASDFAGKIDGSQDDGKTSDLFSRLNFGQEQYGRGRDWYPRGQKHEIWFGRDRLGSVSEVVATPEPGSATLLLFGFLILGTIAYRRSSL
jgi:hypothetical protein